MEQGGFNSGRIIGNIGHFQYGDDIHEYFARMEHLVELNQVPEHLKISFVVCHCSADFFGIITSAVRPRCLKNMSFNELCFMMNKFSYSK